MDGFLTWLTTNANAVSGYVVLIVVVVVGIWAWATGRIISGKQYESCHDALARCLHAQKDIP
jgi:hypothetical protein